MAYEALLRIGNFTAGDDLSTAQFKAVCFSGLNVVLCTSVLTAPLGILQNAPSLAGTAEVALIGSISKWKSTGTHATGNAMLGVTSGMAFELTSGTSGQYILARLLDNWTSTASGLCTVLIVGPSYI